MPYIFMSQSNMSRFTIIILLNALNIVASLSQCKEMADIGCGHNSISNNKFLSDSASLPAAANATNSDSIVEWVIHVCFFEAHEIAPPPILKIQLDVDLLSFILVIQLAS